MKNSKLFISCLSLMIVLLMSSCLDSNDSNSKPTFYSYATVLESGMRLIADDGVTLLPSSSSLSQLKDFSKSERVYVAYTLQDGEIASDKKTSYRVDLVGFAPIKTTSLLNINDANALANDTLKTQNDAVINFDFMSTVNYVTVQSQFYYVANKMPVMLVWKDERVINKDTLFLNLYYNNKKTDSESLGYQPGSLTYSFRTNDLRMQFPTKDTVVVALRGLVNNQIHSNKSIDKTFKVALR